AHEAVAVMAGQRDQASWAVAFGAMLVPSSVFVLAFAGSLHSGEFVPGHLKTIQDFIRQAPELICRAVLLGVHNSRQLLRGCFSDFRVIVQIGIEHMTYQSDCRLDRSTRFRR